MEYLYLPTTTLNFNNILSTGSISPASVYSTRQFGYKKFELVEPNPFHSVLLLYNRYPEFEIESGDRDNHSMILRLCADKISIPFEEGSICTDIKIHICKETIYLDPTSVDFLFPSQEVLNIAVAKSEPSLTTKLVDLFKSSMYVVRREEIDFLKWHKGIIENIREPNNSEDIFQICNRDDRINRLKGFASGYILGAYKAIDPKLAHIRSLMRTVKNEASARLNDPVRNYPGSLRKEVDFSCTTLENFFAEEDVGVLRFDHNKDDYIKFDQNIIKEISDRHVSDLRSLKSFIELINRFSLRCKFYDQLDENRLDIALEGAKAIKELIGSQWEGSQHQNYINALLNNVKNGSKFDFNDSHSLAMKSFAAFILKGDDLDKLESFLIAHGIGNLRIAFALWGAMFGFSKIPKTLYNLPSQQGEIDYLNRMHSYVHSVVHGVPLHTFHRSAIYHLHASPEMTEPVGTPYDPLLEDLRKEIPSMVPWFEKIGQLLHTSGGLSKSFITLFNKTKVEDLGGNIKGVTRKKVSKYFEKKLEAQLPQSQISLNLFETRQAGVKLFAQDSRAWDIIAQVIPAAHKNEIKKDLEWFQREFTNPFSKWYGSKSKKSKSQLKNIPEGERTNQDAIDAFCRSNPLKEKLSEDMIKNIKKELQTKYLQ